MLKNGLRLDKKPVCALSTSDGNHPQDADPAAKVKASVGLHYYRYRVSRQAWPGLKRYADSLLHYIKIELLD